MWQEFDVDFYRQFKIVISGLDAIAPRRWISSLLCGLVRAIACLHNACPRPTHPTRNRLSAVSAHL